MDRERAFHKALSPFKKGEKMISITDKEYRQLVDFIKSRYGIHLGKDKKALVVGRLQQVLQLKGFDTFSDYYQYVLNNQTGEGALTLVEKITTNHTFFMREADHFEFFRKRVLPDLIKSVTERDLRIWSAGCSTGEEPYTLAMMIQDFLGPQKLAWDTKLLATDISHKVLERASQGIYMSEQLAPLPESWRRQYFRSLGDGRQEVVDSLKKEVVFRMFNLMQPIFPFKRKFHVIFCRNVMIYFDTETRKRLLQKFYNHLEPGGYFFIGHSESLHRDETGFQYVMPALYRKEAAV
jgi:chemotaxis protein methyltransferase CheR